MSEAYYPEGPWDLPETPWEDDPDNPENHGVYCTCEDCLQNHPENYLYLDDGCMCGQDNCPECARCWQCGGDGWVTVGLDIDQDDAINNDPPMHSTIKCPCCHGSGAADDCTYW